MRLRGTPRAAAPGLSLGPLVECLGRHLPARRANALLRAAGRGDQAAFGTFFDRTAPVILGCLRRVLRGRGEAERVTENVYVQLWRTAPRFAVEIRSAHAQLALAVGGELIRRRHGDGWAERSRTGAAPVLR